MAKRLFNLGILGSLIAVVLIACLFAFTGVGFSPRHVTFWPGCYLCAEHDHLMMSFYNNAQYGPYRGSIIGMSSPGHPSGIVEHAFGYTAGIYYRHFIFPNGAVLWTLSISIAYPLGVSLISPFVWFCKNFRLRRAETRGFPVEQVKRNNL